MNYTALGGTYEILTGAAKGTQVFGQDPLWLAWVTDLVNLKGSNADQYQHLLTTITPARFKVGQMIGSFGILMGVIVAIYRNVDADKKHQYKGMMIATALATFLTGVTEPIEYMFMFIATPLYLVYALVQGAAFAMADIVHLRMHSFGSIEFLTRTPLAINAGLGMDIICLLYTSRLAKSERSGYWATALSYGVVAPFFVATGGVMALAMFVKTGVYESDPTTMLSTLSTPAFALLSLLLVAFANIGTQGTGSYVNCMIVKSGMPKVSYKLMVWIAMVYVSLLTIWGGVEEYFGSFISLAAYIQGPIIGMIVVDYFILRKRKLDLRSAYFLEGHDAYEFTKGFNLVGLSCVFISLLVAVLFVYNPVTAQIQSPIFLITTGSGFTALFGGLLYWLASLSPLKRYMIKDRDTVTI